MDFTQLMQTMKQIDENLDVDECGGMEMPAVMIGSDDAHAADSLSMNVTINSKGADSIRDLMDILKGISGEHHGEPKDDDSEIVIGDDYENAVEGDKGSKVFGLDAAVFTGDDLASKGKEGVKQAGGGNPWNIRNESLVTHLSSLYEDVKERTQKKR